MVFTILIYVSIDYRIANTAAFILAAAFAYFINSGYVFRARASSSKVHFKRASHFFLLRTASYTADMGLMILLVSVMFFPVVVSKIVVNIVVIILNYAISKYYIFKEVSYDQSRD